MKATIASIGAGIAAAAITYVTFDLTESLSLGLRFAIAAGVGIVGFVAAVLFTDAPIKGRIVILKNVRAKGNVSAKKLDVKGSDVEIVTDVRTDGDIAVEDVKVNQERTK